MVLPGAQASREAEAVESVQQKAGAAPYIPPKCSGVGLISPPISPMLLTPTESFSIRLSLPLLSHVLRSFQDRSFPLQPLPLAGRASDGLEAYVLAHEMHCLLTS